MIRPWKFPSVVFSFAAVTLMMVGHWVGSPLVVVNAPIFAVAGWVHHRRRPRIRSHQQGAEEVVTILDSIMQHLRAGRSLSYAIRREIPGVAVGLRAGSTVESGLRGEAERIGSTKAPEHLLMIQTLQILLRRGGESLTSLERLSDTVRSAQAVAAEVRANAAQAGASALALAMLPAAFAGFFAVIDPRMASFYVREPLGAALGAVAALLSMIGWWWMQAIIRRRTSPLAGGARFGTGTSVIVAGIRALKRRSAGAGSPASPPPSAVGLPEMLDIGAAVLGAGGTIRDTVEVLAESGPPHIRPYFGEVLVRCQQGAPLDQALRWLQAALGLQFQVLTGPLLLAHSQGGAMAPLLGRLASDANRTRRQQGEARARRLPVLLLFPLVACALPAVVIGAIVPLVLVAFRHLTI